MHIQPTSLALYLYDAVYLYLMAVQRLVNVGGDYINGSQVFEAAKAVYFTGKRHVFSIVTVVNREIFVYNYIEISEVNIFSLHLRRARVTYF